MMAQRTAQVLVVHGGPQLAAAVVLSGPLAWIALLAVTASLLRAITARST